MKNKSDLNTLLLYVRAFAVVGDRLGREEAAGGLSALVAIARDGGRPASVEAAGKAFGAVAGVLESGEASRMGVEIAEIALKLVPATAKELLLGGLDAALDETLPRVRKEDAAKLVKPFADAVDRSEGAERLLVLNEAFNRVAADWPEADRVRVTDGLLSRLTPLMYAAAAIDHGRLLMEAVALTAKLLPESQARALAERGPLRGDRALTAAQVEAVCVVAGALASRLPEAEAHRLALRAEGLIRRHEGKTPGELRHLARALAGVARALPAESARALAEELRRRLEAEAAASASAGMVLWLTDGFVSLARLLPEGERRRTATMLMERVLSLVKPGASRMQLRELRLTLVAVAPWVERAELQRESARFAPTVIREVAEQFWVLDVDALLRAVTEALTETELVSLLAMPTCVGPAEDAVLGVLGRRAGRRFENVWQVAAWAAENAG